MDIYRTPSQEILGHLQYKLNTQMHTHTHYYSHNHNTEPEILDKGQMGDILLDKGNTRNKFKIHSSKKRVYKLGLQTLI